MSSDSLDRTIPTPPGGISYPKDAAPSIIFAVAFAALLPVVYLRQTSPATRTTVTVLTSITVLQRVILHSLRAAQALHEPIRFSVGLLAYIDASLAYGSLFMLRDALAIFRCSLVHYTNPPDLIDPYHDTVCDTTRGVSDPRRRQRIRWILTAVDFVLLGLLVPSTLQAVWFPRAVVVEEMTRTVMIARFVVGGGYVILVSGFAIGFYATRKTQWAESEVAKSKLNSLVSLMLMNAGYRLANTLRVVPDLHSTGRGSNQSPLDKVFFYICWCFAEWGFAATILFSRTRIEYRTGAWGDWRLFDEQQPPWMLLNWTSRRRMMNSSVELQ
ncbi:hypothetical protein BKA62DRAFT_265396 [Auriculariales sp. MPI-PUGE-AT-0066]|nr:hypothetical protein BKA62DRAFT_265396 [Auriculariales sp. MPI-PUGE-AT-0066]